MVLSRVRQKVTAIVDFQLNVYPSGEYRVELPDGRVQIVTYHADHEHGFIADVKYEGVAIAEPYAPPPPHPVVHAAPHVVAHAAPLVAHHAPVVAPAPIGPAPAPVFHGRK